MQTIVQITSQLELAGFIKSNGTQCRFVSMIIDTPVVKIKKASPYQGQGVRKIAKKTGIVNANYCDSVSRRLSEKYGVPMEHVAGETWYVHQQTVDGKSLPLVVNKTKQDGKLYLQFFPHSSRHEYVLPNGDILPFDQLAPWLYAESKRPDYKPTVISVELGNIRELRASGVIMQTTELEEAERILDIENPNSHAPHSLA
jgi:hypothetical protein